MGVFPVFSFFVGGGDMRIFLCVTRNLGKDVPFQKTIPHVTGVLERLGLTYGRSLFAFQDTPNAKDVPFNRTSLGKLFKAYPELAPCLRPPAISAPGIATASNFPAVSGLAYGSFPEVPGLTPGTMAAIAEKIPRPYAFYSAAIVLDMVPWFGFADPRPALPYPLADAPCALDPVGNNYDASCGFYQSDCIVLDKRFDWGTAHNPIHLRFEVTKFVEAGTLPQAGQTIRELCSRFGGTLLEWHMVCCLSPEDMARAEAGARELRGVLERCSDAWRQVDMPSHVPFDGGSYHPISEPGAVPYKAPSRAAFFRKILGPAGFIPGHPGIGGTCDFGKIIADGNYALGLSPWFHGNHLNVRLDCGGYNFSVSHILASDRPFYCKRDLELYAADLIRTVELWEAQVVPEIRRIFGATPSWYAHSIPGRTRPGIVIRNQP